MYEIVKGGSTCLVEVRQFLAECGLPANIVSQKILACRKNPYEYVFVIGRNQNEEIVGLAEITVEHKLTRGSGKMYHVGQILTGKLNQEDASSFRKEIQKFIGEQLKENKCYKAVISCTDKNRQKYHQESGFKQHQIFMYWSLGYAKQGSPKL